MAGICLIRLKYVRPQFVPPWLGISSENAAHRVAVEWEENGVRREGVYVRRRDTNSRLNELAGGRLFPGIHHRARFAVQESHGHYDVNVSSDDGQTDLGVKGSVVDELPTSSIFHSLRQASEFFRTGSLGYSATAEPGCFQGLELRCHDWQVAPLAIEEVWSNFFDDEKLFPRDSIHFDCALLMRNIEHEWYGRRDLCVSEFRNHIPAAISEFV